MRAFVAIGLPEDVRAQLESVQDHLRVGRVSDPATFHLTLAFLGDHPIMVLEEVHHALAEVRLPEFELRLRGLGVFGGKAPRVLWAGIEPGIALEKLQRQVRSAIRSAGVDLPRARFRPHVTLARFGARLEPEEIRTLRMFLERFERFPCPRFVVTEFAMYQSILRRDGPVHEPLAHYELVTIPAR